MPVLLTLTTGAGVVSQATGQAQCENMITIGDCDTANPLQGLQVEIDGTSFLNIASPNAALITAFMKWLSQITASTVASVLKLATGKVQRSTTYRFTNAGATTPIVYATSDAGNGVPMLAGTKFVNASSYDDFKRFSALMIATPANVQQVEILFKSGVKNIFAIQEVDSLYAIKRPTEADGRLGGVSVIDNTDQSIDAVRIYTLATGTTVLIIKLPDTSFEIMKAAAEDLQLALSA